MYVISCGWTVGITFTSDNPFLVDGDVSALLLVNARQLLFFYPACTSGTYCVTPVGRHEWPDGCAKELIGGNLGPFHQPVFHPRASCTHWEIMQICTSRTDIFQNLFQWHLDRYRLCRPPKTMLACAKTYFPPCWIASYKTAFSELSQSLKVFDWNLKWQLLAPTELYIPHIKGDFYVIKLSCSGSFFYFVLTKKTSFHFFNPLSA